MRERREGESGKEKRCSLEEIMVDLEENNNYYVYTKLVVDGETVLLL